MSPVLLYHIFRSHEASKALFCFTWTFLLTDSEEFIFWQLSSSLKPLLIVVASNHQHKASKASFVKLKGVINYESWACNMAAALQTVKLWSLITDQRKWLFFYIMPSEATLEDKNHVWKWNETIIAYKEKKRTIVRWIHLMCINEI